MNDLNQLETLGDITCFYNLNGDLIQKNDTVFSYNPLHKLTSATFGSTCIQFSHDPLGRIYKRTKLVLDKDEWQEVDTELYLHDNQEEIGSFYPDGRAKHLRILGIGKETVAVELDGKPFACITDIHRNIERLIDAHAKTANYYQYSAFGETLLSEETVFNPWRYAGKRFDPDLQLFSFGKRFYDPELIRWLTPDPAGFTDSYNLYQYVLTNPFRYYDPDGQFVFLIPIIQLVLPNLAIIIPILAKTTIAAAATYAFYKALENFDHAQQLDDPLLAYKTFAAEGKLLEEKEKEEKKQQPPYDGKELGNDPAKCPDEGFEWRGSGLPESGLGNWVKGKGKDAETLHPDFNHPEPIKPHWDYTGPNFPKEGGGVRLYLDGTWELKL